MNIGGFLKQSFVDFPANISAVIFTNGCNFDCWYCHNKGLLSLNNKPKYNFDEIYQFLKSRKNFLDGVVISGGEPTLQKDLEEVVDKIKELGLKVKLDTNGTNPRMLQKLLPKLDYVAMDIKNSLENYGKITSNPNIERIKESVEILKNSSIDYEFRTTYSPDITFEDFEKIGELIEGARAYYLQTYNPQEENLPRTKAENYEKALEIVKKHVKFAQKR